MCQIGPGTTSALLKKQPIMSDLRGSRTPLLSSIEFPFFWHGSLKYEAPSLGPDLRGCLGGLRYNEDVRSPNVSVQLCIGWNDNQGSQIPELTTLARFNQGLRYQSNCQSVDITIIGIRSWVISFNCYHANTKQQSRSLTINRTIAVPYLGRYRGSSIGRTYCRSFTRVWMMQMSSARRNASFALELPNIHLGNQGCRVTANS